MALVVTVEEQELIERMITLYNDLGRVRLYKTKHKMRKVTHSMGREIADRAIARYGKEET